MHAYIQIVPLLAVRMRVLVVGHFAGGDVGKVRPRFAGNLAGVQENLGVAPAQGLPAEHDHAVAVVPLEVAEAAVHFSWVLLVQRQHLRGLPLDPLHEAVGVGEEGIGG